MSKKPKKNVYTEEEYPFKKRWLPFSNQICTNTEFHEVEVSPGIFSTEFKEFVTKRKLIQNTANTSMDCRVLTVKHLKVDVRVAPLSGVTVNDVWNSIVEVFKLSYLKFADRSVAQYFLQELISCKAVLYYNPTKKGQRVNCHIKEDDLIVLDDNCLEKQHPEWILASVPVIFDHHGVGHAHLEVEVAKNLRQKEKISIAVAGLIKNNIDWKTFLKDKVSISFDYSYVACV